MTNDKFKKLFSDVAQSFEFEKAYGGWFKASVECIVVLDLQKSNFENSYYLNLKIFFQGAFGNQYILSKDLIKKDVGNIFTRQPFEYRPIFNLDQDFKDIDREYKLSNFFEEFVLPISIKALTKKGIIELEESGRLSLLPAVKKELTK